MQLRRRENELRYFRLTHVGDRQRPIAVIRLLAEETAQSQIVIKRIFDIERLEPLGIETDELGSDGDGLGVYVWGHRTSRLLFLVNEYGPRKFFIRPLDVRGRP
jgi:hypothetical protein